MDAQDFRSLQEAYMEVVENQQLDEVSHGDDEYERQYSHKVSRGMKKVKPHSSQTLEGEKNPTGKYAAMQRRKRQGLSYKEQVDLYDIILSHLLDEGYAETVESAQAIMVNMSEDWREEIVEAKADTGLSDEEKEDARNARKFGTSGKGYFNPRGTTELRRGLHKSRRGMTKQDERRWAGEK